MTHQEIMQAIRNAQEGKGLRQVDIKAITGIAQDKISKYYKGEHIPSLENTIKIAGAVGLELTVKKR